MFTVKHIDCDNREIIKSCDKVTKYQDTATDGTNLFPREVVAIWCGEEAENIFSGKVYVMNDYGKTVASYNLFASRECVNRDSSSSV